LIKKSQSSKPFLPVQVIVLAAAGWALIALLFFLLFSQLIPRQGFPVWYRIVTYVLEEVSFLGATLLCLRNWRSSQIVSGRTVWLMLGLGMLSYFTGNLILAYWELGLGKSPDVSPGDIFFLLTYFFMGAGMLLAVLSRRLNLTVIQWIIVVVIAVLGVAIAYFTSIAVPEEEAFNNTVPGINQPVLVAQAPPAAASPNSPPPVSDVTPTVPAATPAQTQAPAATPAPPAQTQAPATPPAPPAQVQPPAAQPTPQVPVSPTPATEEPTAEDAPGWAIAIENFLVPYSGIVSWMYIVGDISLLVMATTLLLAFWGGRFSMSWRFIAASAFSFYIADIWFNFATNYIENYTTGALLEVFWIFSGVLVSIGAALEYDLSTRSRRSGRRRPT
jgi:hypothetical protein